MAYRESWKEAPLPTRARFMSGTTAGSVDIRIDSYDADSGEVFYTEVATGRKGAASERDVVPMEGSWVWDNNQREYVEARSTTPSVTTQTTPTFTASDVLAELFAERYTGAQAVAKLRELGWSEAQANEQVSKGLVTARGPGGALDMGGTPTATPTNVPRRDDPMTKREFFSQDIEKPLAAFRRHFGATPLPGGVPRGDISRRFLENRAATGFTMAPFLRPELETESQFRDFVQRGIGSFAQGGGTPFGGVPEFGNILSAFRQAALSPTGLPEAQRALAGRFQQPEQNQEVFNMLVGSRLGGMGRFWQEIFGNLYDQLFDQFQEGQGNRSFLQGAAGAPANDPLSWFLRA